MVEENNYILLKYESAIKEINKPGIYNLQKIFNPGTSDDRSLIMKIIDYVSSEIIESLENEEFITGAVTRGVHPIVWEIPSRNNLLENSIELKWRTDIPITNFKTIVTDRYGREIVSIPVKSTSCNLSLDSAKFRRGEYYYCKVVSQDNPDIISDEIYFSFLDSERQKEIIDTLANINSFFEKSDSSSLLHIYLANYYASRNINLKAKEEYEIALTMAPMILEYKKLYDRFLTSVNLKIK